MCKVTLDDVVGIVAGASGSVVLALLVSVITTVTIQGNTDYNPNEGKPSILATSAYWITFAISVSSFFVIVMAIFGVRKYKKGMNNAA